MFKRKAYQQLQNWKKVSHGKTAALIEGARRIGKSTVAEAFARAEYDDYFLIDFSREGEDIRRLFLEDINNLDTFFRHLFLIKGRRLPPKQSVIIFDEVQLFPLARQAIKILVNDGRYDYIETGSLISIKQNTKNILIPSEEYRIRMYPMDFEEFLFAREDNVTVPAIRDAFDERKPLGDKIHRRIMRNFREYLAVGGMPQAVDAFIQGDTYEEIDFIKRSILNLYEEDLHKRDDADGGMTSAIFKSIPEQLSHHNSHFKFADIEKNARYHTLMESLNFLDESMMVNMCYNVTVPETLMDLYIDKANFKMFLGDTGLLVTQSITNGSRELNALYKAVVLDRLSANQGMLMENMVAQMLVCNGHDLRFHEFNYVSNKNDTNAENNREKKYEIDFLLLRDKRVCPIEVKSSGYRTHKSLDRYHEKYGKGGGESFILYTKDLHEDGAITYLPIYMAMCL